MKDGLRQRLADIRLALQFPTAAAGDAVREIRWAEDDLRDQPLPEGVTDVQEYAARVVLGLRLPSIQKHLERVLDDVKKLAEEHPAVAPPEAKK